MLTIRRCLNACIQRSKENQSDDDKDEESEKENISVRKSQQDFHFLLISNNFLCILNKYFVYLTPNAILGPVCLLLCIL